MLYYHKLCVSLSCHCRIHNYLLFTVIKQQILTFENPESENVIKRSILLAPKDVTPIKAEIFVYLPIFVFIIK